MRNLHVREHQEPRVVGDQVQALLSLLRGPADELVPGAALPGRRTEQQAGEQPAASVRNRVLEILADSTAAAQVVKLRQSGGKPRWIKLTDDDDTYIPRFGWIREGWAWAQLLNRKQDTMDLFFIDTKSGKGSADTAFHARNFLDCVKSRGKCNCDIEIGHRSTSATLIANIALRTKSYLEWDGKAERFANNEAANRYLQYKYRTPYKLG